jgi:hypothetical protein
MSSVQDSPDLQHDNICPKRLIAYQSSGNAIVREAVRLNLPEDVDGAQTTHDPSYNHRRDNQHG